MNMETVRVYNKERAKEWKKVLGTDNVPIVSLISQPFNLPIGEKYCYLLDLKQLSKEQKENLIKHLTEKFKLDKMFVEKNIEKQGVPILVDDCIVSSTEIYKYLDDWDNESEEIDDYDDYCEDFDNYGGMK